MKVARIVAIALVCGTASAHAASTLEQALSRLQDRYETTQNLTADFRQTVESPTLAGALESKGKVAFAKPNRMRWDYDPPDRQTIVGDGETLWIYQPDDRQVIKAPLNQAFQARTPMNFLAGLGRVEKEFQTDLVKDDAETWVLKLTPLQDKGIGTIVLTVRKRDAAVAEARITDPLGTTTRIQLIGEKRNTTIPASQFTFKPPPGVDVVKPPTP